MDAVRALLHKNSLVVCPRDSIPKIKSIIKSVPTRQWQITIVTSGSTGQQKLVGLHLEQLDWTISRHREIYSLTHRSMVATALPLTYNFPFVAGVWLTARTGATFLHNNDPLQLVTTIQDEEDAYDRFVVLANPVMLQSMIMINQFLGSRVLIDSGGAPLSRAALLWLREKIAETREGYGLTETCSLTHFDTEGSIDSLRTVGQGVHGVRTEIASDGSAGEILIKSPNIGTYLYEKIRNLARLFNDR